MILAFVLSFYADSGDYFVNCFYFYYFNCCFICCIGFIWNLQSEKEMTKLELNYIAVLGFPLFQSNCGTSSLEFETTAHIEEEFISPPSSPQCPKCSSHMIILKANQSLQFILHFYAAFLQVNRLWGRHRLALSLYAFLWFLKRGIGGGRGHFTYYPTSACPLYFLLNKETPEVVCYRINIMCILTFSFTVQESVRELNVCVSCSNCALQNGGKEGD